jgi:hypothetical protein
MHENCRVVIKELAPKKSAHRYTVLDFTRQSLLSKRHRIVRTRKATHVEASENDATRCDSKGIHELSWQA